MLEQHFEKLIPLERTPRTQGGIHMSWAIWVPVLTNAILFGLYGMLSTHMRRKARRAKAPSDLDRVFRTSPLSWLTIGGFFLIFMSAGAIGCYYDPKFTPIYLYFVAPAVVLLTALSVYNAARAYVEISDGQVVQYNGFWKQKFSLRGIRKVTLSEFMLIEVTHARTPKKKIQFYASYKDSAMLIASLKAGGRRARRKQRHSTENRSRNSASETARKTSSSS